MHRSLRLVSRLALAGCAFGLVGVASALSAQQPAPTPAAPPSDSIPLVMTDSGAFTIFHGADTVASERFARNATEIRGSLMLAGASQGVQVYKAVVGPDATMPLVEVTVRQLADSGRREGKVVQRARVIFKDDSAAVDALTDHGIDTRVFGTKRGAVPYLNLSFGLLEQAVHRARAVGTGKVEVPFFNLGGGQTAVGTFAPAKADTIAFVIGTVEYHLRVDAAGRILGARIPAQDVRVERR